MFTLSRAITAGIPRVALNRLVTTGVIHRVQPEVYAFTATPSGWMRDLQAVVLAAPGAAVAGRAALALWDVPAPHVLEFTIERGPQPRLFGDVVVHRSTGLEPEDVVLHKGLPVTTPARSLLDAGLTWKLPC